MSKKSKYSPTKNGTASVPRAKQPYVSPDGETVMMTDKQHQFVQTALEQPTSETLIKRTMEIYNTDRQNALVIARQNFNKPNLLLYMGDRGYRALDTINEVMTKSDKDELRLAAARDLADRAFGKATQRQEIKQQTVSVNLTFNNAPIND